MRRVSIREIKNFVLRSLPEMPAPSSCLQSGDPMTTDVSASVAIRSEELTIIPPLQLQRVGITATLNQNRTSIDHNGLAGAEAFLHQKQVGLREVMSFADTSYGQTLAHAFKELLPF